MKEIAYTLPEATLIEAHKSVTIGEMSTFNLPSDAKFLYAYVSSYNDANADTLICATGQWYGRIYLRIINAGDLDCTISSGRNIIIYYATAT